MRKSGVFLESMGVSGSEDTELTASATGPWKVPNLGASLRSTVKLGEFLFNPISFMMALALTPMTAVDDPWRPRGQHQHVFVETWHEVRRRKLNLRDARRLALLTMANAEKARTVLVDAEFEFVSRLEQ